MIKALFFVACLLVSLVAVASVVQAQQAVGENKKETNLSEVDRAANLESFDYVWRTVRDRYWDPDLEGVDWEAAKAEFRPQVQAARTKQEARQAIRNLLRKLKVSHFGIIPESAYAKLDEHKPRGRHTTGMDVRVVDDRVLVTEVRKDSPADKLGIRIGWEIIRIGDTEVGQRLAEITDELKDHPHQRTILVDAAQGRLLGQAGESINVWFRNGSDQEVEFNVPLADPHGKKAKFGHIPEFHIWIESTRLENDIGYIRFNAFMDPAYIMPQFNKAMRDFADAPGIIIDVRGNGGGLGEMGTQMMGWLLKGGRKKIGTVRLRDNELKMLVHPRAESYDGPVVVLIDEMSISAAEFFASGMQDLELAHLIGNRTAGAVLGSSIERLPNGDGFQFARANYFSGKTGESLEGVGVSPHQVVSHTRQALLKGMDLQVAAAIAWIKEKNHDENQK